MIERIDRPLPFFTVVKEILSSYAHIFKPIFGLVVLASLVQAVVGLYVGENPTVGLAISILAALVAMFLYAWILTHADNVMMERKATIRDALAVAKHRFLPLLGVLAIYIFLVGLLVLFVYGLMLVGKLLHMQQFFGFIGICLALFVLILLSFTMPSVIIDRMPVFKSFVNSATLVWHHWWHTFGVIFLFLIPVVLLSLLVALAGNQWALAAFEFIYHILTYPLMVALVLVLYHDLKARHQAAGFKQVVEREPHN